MMMTRISGSEEVKQERLTHDRQAVRFKMNICGTPPADGLIEADLPGVVKTFLLKKIRPAHAGGAGLHRSSWTVLTRMSSMYQTIARIVTTLVGVGLMFILCQCRTLTAPRRSGRRADCTSGDDYCQAGNSNYRA